jgi:branched-chain amino acid transport system substrate-binding protein
MRPFVFASAILGAAVLCQPASAEIKVGVVVSLSGNAASLGVPYGQGVNAGAAYSSKVGDETVRFIQLDDGSDPSAAARAARKLIEEEGVDVIIGTATSPSTAAIAAVANELHVPFLAISPLPPAKPGTDTWAADVPPPPPLMINAVTDRMKRDGMKDVGFIGFSDSWGDFVYDTAKKAEVDGGFKLLTNERYARTDTSVTGQVLKIISAKPDSVLLGGSGSQAALPALALRERGFKGPLFGSPAMLNADFIRIAGKSADGMLVSAGPSIVAEQLPDSHYSKTLSLQYRDIFLKANGVKVADAFSAYSFDAWLLFLDAAKRAGAKNVKPGTPDYRLALRDAIFTTKDFSGTTGIYNFQPGGTYGADQRSLVMVRLVDGAWKYEP